MVPGFSPLGPGSRRMVKRTSGNARSEAALHHLALVVGLDVGSAEVGWRAFALAGAWGWRRVGDEGIGCVGIAAGDVGLVVGAGAEGLVGVDAGRCRGGGQVDEFADFAGVGVGLVEGVFVGLGIDAREEDAVGLVADDDGVGSTAEARHG